MQEFDLISKVFAPLAGDGAPAYGLKNDTACFTPPEGCDLVFTKDLMIEDVHFPKDAAPFDLARRLMRVNLSDLAAAGATPVGYLLGIAATGHENEAWFQSFADGLKVDQDEFGLTLWGGDTTSGSKSLCLSLTAIGQVKKGEALMRIGAKAGDGIYVTGSIGDAALGLKVLLNTFEGASVENKNFLLERFNVPQPRTTVGQGLCGVASAAVDVSDGLLADVEHLAKASALMAVIQTKQLPLSAAVRACVEMDNDLCDDVLSGGDDYELVFTAPKGSERAILDLGWRTGVLITRIGHMEKGKGLSVLDLDGQAMNAVRKGYQHLMENSG